MSRRDTMRAIVIQDTMRWSVEDVPMPEPGDRDILVRIIACGLCGSDLRTIRSGHPNVTVPAIIGHEISAEVVETGTRYDGPLAPGDLLAIGPIVYNPTDPFCVDGRQELSSGVREIGQDWPGGMAEYMVVPSEALELGNVLKLPHDMNPIHAALVEPGSSVMHAIERAHIGLGDRVLVMGAGPIGALLVAAARAAGAERVIVTNRRKQRLKLIEPFGPDAGVLADDAYLREKIDDLTDGRGVNVVITANPSPEAPVEAVEICAKGGRVVLFGGLPKENSAPRVDLNTVHYQNLDLIGVSRFAPRHFRASLAMLRTGKVDSNALISSVLPIEEADAGITRALDGEVLKVVFAPSAAGTRESSA